MGHLRIEERIRSGTARLLFNNPLELHTESALVGPDHPGIALDNIAFFSIENRQPEPLSDIEVIVLIGFKKNTTQAYIVYFSWKDLFLNRIFYIQGTWLARMFT